MPSFMFSVLHYTTLRWRGVHKHPVHPPGSAPDICRVYSVFPNVLFLAVVEVWLAGCLQIAYVGVGLVLDGCDQKIYVVNEAVGNCSASCDSNLDHICCPNFTAALQYISNNPMLEQCADVSLPPGLHTITQPYALNASVVIKGNESIIECKYESSQEPVRDASKLNYTLFFQQARFVKFEQVQFKGCGRPFRLEEVENVLIIDSNFTQFTDAVFDLYNCMYININRSVFFNNSGIGTVLLPFRGNSGAVSVGYYTSNNFNNMSQPIVLITESHFISNDAGVNAETFQTSTTAFLDSRFTGRGGGLAILMGLTVGDVFVNISRCSFQQNHAVSFGGAVYLLFSGYELHHMITIEDSNFTDNIADNGAGAIQISYVKSEVLTGPPMTALIRSCIFTGNKAFIAGGIFLFPSSLGTKGSLMILENCYFYRNEAGETGAAITASQFAFFVPKDILENHRVTNCTFVENFSPGAIVAVVYTALEFTGVNNFSNNSGPVMRVVGTLVDVHDTMIFEENNSLMEFSAALYIQSFGQVRVFPKAKFLFARNIGRFGSGIIVQSSTSSVVYNHLIHNPQCFLLYAERDTPFVQLDSGTVNFTFANNTALLGASLFLAGTEPCSWIGNQRPYFDNTSILDWKFATVIGTSHNASIRTASAKLTLPDNVTSWPGQRKTVPMNVTDDFGLPTYGLVGLLPRTSNSRKGNVVFNHNVQIAAIGRGLNVEFATDRKVDLGDRNQTRLITVQELVSSVHASFSLIMVPCIAGYKLTKFDKEFSCQCNLNNLQIIQCEADQTTVLLEDGLWASSDLSDPDDNLKLYTCPPGYCRCSRLTSFGSEECHYVYNNSNPNQQCHCDREGFLCGNCKDGKGVSILFNNCVNCDNGFGALLGLLIIVDAIVIMVILLKGVSLPVWLLPGIFNIQMISYVGEYYPVTYEKIGKYIYYIGSVISLYFPYDFCLYSETSALASYTFRYIPLWLSLSLSIAVFIYHYRKQHYGAACCGTWTLILLLYSHVVYTSMSLLNCPSLNDSSGVYKPRWFFNATIECFKEGGHLVLAIWAIIVLTFCVSLVLFVGAVSKRILKTPYWLLHFTRVLRHPYKLQWWCQVELGRRFVFLLLLTIFPRNTSPLILLLMIIFVLYTYFMPYKDLLINIAELVFQLAFLLFLLLRSTSAIVNKHHKFSTDDVLDVCSDNMFGVTDLAWLLSPFAWSPVFGTVLIAVCHLANLKSRQQHIKEWYLNRNSDMLTWVDESELHYETVFTEFVPGDSRSWKFIQKDDLNSN